VFITENLTTRRRKIMDELNYLRTNRKKVSRNRTNTITRGMLVLLVDRKRVLLDFISVGIRQARFITYRQRQALYCSKSKLKNNPNKVFITENVTTRRRKIMDELNYLRTNRKCIHFVYISWIGTWHIVKSKACAPWILFLIIKSNVKIIILVFQIMPKICESVCDNINEKYERLLNEVVKPLQDTVNNQAAMIQEQKGTIDKHVSLWITAFTNALS
jgi:hypothetical protein